MQRNCFKRQQGRGHAGQRRVFRAANGDPALESTAARNTKLIHNGQQIKGKPGKVKVRLVVDVQKSEARQAPNTCRAPKGSPESLLLVVCADALDSNSPVCCYRSYRRPARAKINCEFFGVPPRDCYRKVNADASIYSTCFQVS